MLYQNLKIHWIQIWLEWLTCDKTHPGFWIKVSKPQTLHHCLAHGEHAWMSLQPVASCLWDNRDGKGGEKQKFNWGWAVLSFAEGRFASASTIAHNRANYETFKDQSIAGYHSYKPVLLLHYPWTGRICSALYKSEVLVLQVYTKRCQLFSSAAMKPLVLKCSARTRLQISDLAGLGCRCI